MFPSPGQALVCKLVRVSRGPGQGAGRLGGRVWVGATPSAGGRVAHGRLALIPPWRRKDEAAGAPRSRIKPYVMECAQRLNAMKERVAALARRQAKKRKRGFSLKAFLAVVVVLGLLAFCAYRQREVLVPRGRAILTQQIDRLLHRGEQGSPLPAPPAGPPTHDGPAPQGIPVQSSHDNLALGIPGCADTLVDRPGYALGYIEYHEQPAWVVYRMTRQEVLAKAATRGDDFREDPNIPTGSATLDDYRRSGYDRGHLAPAADMAFSVEAMSESFYMSNMSPQLPAFNRGVWKVLEEQVRQFAMDEQDIYIVTGPILPTTKNVTIGANKVTVPPQYYKVVYDRTPPEKMIGFIVPHEPSSKPLQEFAVTVDAVEAATGLDFFSLVPQPRQEILECTLSVKDWGWGK